MSVCLRGRLTCPSACAAYICLALQFLPPLINRSFRAVDAQEITEDGDSADAGEKERLRRIEDEYRSSWRRIMLLILAVTVHNIPEGLAVGVGFGSIGKTEAAKFETAFNLAIGIGLQNFPEGLAVSLPLAAFGHSKLKVGGLIFILYLIFILWSLLPRVRCTA
ncbi:unnamed protein product [Nippostrongylus brasiliensis]|uniref:Zinc transporter ZIP11 n=1 Tax=Nippostrongylus brasiliensis TaxID=27835 RepID=A0A0N4XQ07_NIPBR|nr:unnamed protein product [Nippostrongylus brasiliensis]